MARLNEPATESVESLTRRFIRQNRDLTRANAAQSIKIRALENQVSGLLAENLTLRGSIIELRAELDDGRNREIIKNVFIVQKQLETKLQEFNGLIYELGHVQAKVRRRQSQIAATPKSPRARNWRNRATFGDLVTGQEGQLPTIVEGKHFPRRTLDSAEIMALTTEISSESPEMGPPPRAYFDRDGEESIDAQPSKVPESVSFEDDVEVPGLFSANFETRRRRRETYVRADDPNKLQKDAPAESNRPDFKRRTSPSTSNRLLRVGAKRKLDSQGSHEETESTNPDVATQMSPKRQFLDNHIIAEQQARTTERYQLQSEVLRPLEGDMGLNPPKRKALGPKSTNVSPKKVFVLEKPDTERSAKSVPRAQNHEAKDKSLLPITHDEDYQDTLPVEEVMIKTEPKTPAHFDLVSPVSTQPSEAPAGSTAPRPSSPRPADRRSFGGAARGSRRARANVSYAEPNLISKMRRPTRDLVDAVGGDQKHYSNGLSNTIPVKEEESGQSSERGAARTVSMSRDEAIGKDWKPATSSTSRALPRPEPQSPLRDKEDSSKPQLVDRTTSRERRRSTLHPTGEPSKQLASSTTIRALVPPGRKDSPDTNGDPASKDLLAQAMESLEIYDVKDSSSPYFASHINKTGVRGTDTGTGTDTENKQLGSHPPRPPLSLNRSASTGSHARLSVARPGARRQTLGSGSGGSGSSGGSSNSTGSGVPGKAAEVSSRLGRQRELKPAASEGVLNDGLRERVANRRRSVM